ncbi:MAG: bifunctional aspartokinase / homoserine dehydrogenase 1 [Bacteroidales bacterium]|nr:bifunctional aspartokinase / homoserine dehydrogenase 1 [Bacteroidales bacterium]
MSYQVVKFGGSNLRDIDGIKKVIQAVKNYNQPLIIVVSAFYGMTNRLINAVEKSAAGKMDIARFTRDIRNQKWLLIQQIIKDKDNLLLDQYCIEFEKRLERLKENLTAVTHLNEVPPEIYDEVLSFGERLSSLTLFYILTYFGVDCCEALPEDIGLFTDGEYKNASVDFERTEIHLRKALSVHKTYIIPGFYGISPDGCTTLLGRGGSDYSAAAIAACLNAQSLDLWKDVEGFLSADPEIVSGTVNVNELTYGEASELSYFGSQILHPRTTEPLAKANIPIRIMDIHQSCEGIRPFTIIHKEEKITSNVVKSVAYSDHFGLLKLSGSGVGIKPGILAKSAVALDDAGINIQSVITSQTAINILLAKKELSKAKNIILQKDIHGISDIGIDSNISVIAAVGQGLVSKAGIAGRIFSAVARKGINIKIICFGASNVAMYFIVDKNNRNETVKEIHDEFFSGEVCCDACV